MEFIKNTTSEKTLCDNSIIKKRNNSAKIDYFNKINDKPWGKEYLAYQNKYIGIWILHVNRDQETSLHCHFKKDTILIPLTGCFKINLYEDNYKILNVMDSVFVPRNTFHGIHSYTDNGILMEIEIYTKNIEYTDKNDLLRIKDIYNRDKDKYETSVLERIPNDGEIMSFSNQNNYLLDKTHVSHLKVNNLFGLNTYDKIILLKGTLYTNGKRITSGSFIDINDSYSLLSEYVELLCISNIDYKYLSKIIYSQNHLKDFLLKKNQVNIGLTSGCFDILHEGHLTNLKLCKKKCDSLYVCLSSDEQIKRLKGDNRPINRLEDRVNMLIHYDFIDLIILYNEINDEYQIELDNIINIINPYIWFKGSDYTKEDILNKHPSLKHVELINLIKDKSTTNIINKICIK
jgi:rfaE bifunctional protein nucleotidyltransferase chain/domain